MAIDLIGPPAPIDPASGVAGLRTLGTGANQAASGADLADLVIQSLIGVI